jgi:hypothetical protein
MSGRRKLYLDIGVGERRGVVTLDDLPERLLIARDGDEARLSPGAVLAARIARVETGLGIAFLEAPDGERLIVARAGLPDGSGEGRFVAVQVLAPARRGKAASAKVLSPDQGPVRWISEAPDLRRRLQAFAPESRLIEGAEARAAADEAVLAVAEVEFPLSGGGRLTIEPTRALLAVDVDVGAAAGRDARFSATKINQLAIHEAARLARLKGLGGLMVIDLAGKGHNGPLLIEAAKAAFAPDQPGVALGAISRFGVLEIVLPWRTAPVIELLTDPDGRMSVMTEALGLIRAIEGEAGPGRRVRAVCSPKVAAAANALAPRLTERIGARFEIVAAPECPRAGWTAKSL